MTHICFISLLTHILKQYHCHFLEKLQFLWRLMILQTHMIEENFLNIRIFFNENGQSEIKDKLSGNLLMNWKFLVIDHLLKKFTFMFMNSPIILLALLRAIIKTFALRAELYIIYHRKSYRLRRHQLHMFALRDLRVAHASGYDCIIFVPAFSCFIAKRPLLLGAICLSSNIWFILYVL